MITRSFRYIYQVKIFSLHLVSYENIFFFDIYSIRTILFIEISEVNFTFHDVHSIQSHIIGHKIIVLVKISRYIIRT